MENEVKEVSQKNNMLRRRKSFVEKRKEEGHVEAKNEESIIIHIVQEEINEEPIDQEENNEASNKEENKQESTDQEKKNKGESMLTRWRTIFSFIPKKSFFLALGVLMAVSIVENGVTSTLMTYLTNVRKDKLTTAAMTVNLLQVITGLLSLPATYYKNNYVGSYHLTVISSLAYSTGLWFMWISSLSRTKFCHKMLPHGDRCHKSESPLFYIGLVLVGLGRAGFSSSCVNDFLEDQVKAKLNEKNEDSIIAINFQRKLDTEKNKYVRHEMKKIQNEGIIIDDMTREDKIDTAVVALSSIFRTCGVILGIIMVWFLRNWAFRFAISMKVLQFALGLFLMGWFFASYVYCGHCFTTKSTGGCNTDKGGCNPDNRHSTEEPAVNDDGRNLVSKESSTKHNNSLLILIKVHKTLLLGMIPICLPFIMYGIVKSTGKSFFVEQGKNMDRTLGHIDRVPLSILLPIGNVSGMFINGLVTDFFNRRYSANERIYGILTRIGLGLVCSIICCGTARWSEIKRLGVARDNGLLDNSTGVVPLSVFYLLPQFISYGAMRYLAVTGLKVFFEYELPEPIDGYASGLADAVIGVGVFCGVIAVPITQKLSQIFGGNSMGWFADSINHSHLDYFYTTLIIFCLLNILLYAYVSTSYIKKRSSSNKEVQEDKCEEDPFE